MRILISLMLVCLHVAYADPPHVRTESPPPPADLAHYHANIRYRIHPRLGDFVAIKHVCDDRDLRERLWRVIRKLPVVTAHQDGSLDLDLDLGKVFTPDRLIFREGSGKVVGWWATSTPDITLGIVIEERERYLPIVQVVVKQVRGEAWCAAMWSGITDDKF